MIRITLTMPMFLMRIIPIAPASRFRVASHPGKIRYGGTMQISFKQYYGAVSTRLLAFPSPSKLSRYLPDSLYLNIAVAAGMLWLALSSF